MDRETQAGWLTDTVGVRRLTERVLVRVVGEDARAWLNGQVTNDLRGLSPGGAVYALVIHVKGRILADLFALDRGPSGLGIVVPRANLAALLEHFEKYVIMEDVALRPDEGIALLTVQGPRAAAIVGTAPDAYPCDRLGRGGFDVLVAAEAAEARLAQLAVAATEAGGGVVSEEAWELGRLRLGRPELFADFGEGTYPQEVGLERIAVSFSKGCYLGQEVVCMLENRGQLTRRLVRLESEAVLAPGDPLEASGQRVGEITSAARDGSRSVALGFVKRALATPGAELRAPAGAARVLAASA